jgi:hypothetical protein
LSQRVLILGLILSPGDAGLDQRKKCGCQDELSIA